MKSSTPSYSHGWWPSWRKSSCPSSKAHAISGLSAVNTEDPVFEDPLALAMLIDVFSERGYHATVDKRKAVIPERVDLTTGEITKPHRVGVSHPNPLRRFRDPTGIGEVPAGGGGEIVQQAHSAARGWERMDR